MLLAGQVAVQDAQFNAPLAYAQTPMTQGGVMQESGPSYQISHTGIQDMLPETPPPQQAVPVGMDMSLEAIMRQAQMGLFALPGKEEYS